MIGAVTDGPDHSIPGDTPRTTITLASPLAYQYKRDTVHIYGNVVKASHGESTTEPLGSGNAATPQQSFELKRPPMTFTSAPTISGVNSSETVRVDGVRYDRVNSLLDAGPSDRVYQLEVDETGRADGALRRRRAWRASAERTAERTGCVSRRPRIGRERASGADQPIDDPSARRQRGHQSAACDRRRRTTIPPSAFARARRWRHSRCRRSPVSCRWRTTPPSHGDSPGSVTPTRRN